MHPPVFFIPRMNSRDMRARRNIRLRGNDARTIIFPFVIPTYAGRAKKCGHYGGRTINMSINWDVYFL